MGHIITIDDANDGVNMSFGENVKRWRGYRRLTQGELADKSGLGLNLISRLERESTDTKVSSLIKLISALECSADDLIDEIGKTNVNGKLKRQFERASNLPDDEKEFLARMIEKYCNAVLYEIMIDNGEIKP